MTKSLGAILAIGLAGLQLVAVLAVVFFSYVTSESALLSHARTLLNDVGDNATEHAKGFLKPARAAAELAARLSENDILASNDPTLLERFLFQQLLVAPQFSGLYYGASDGGFIFVMRTTDPAAPYMTKIIRENDGIPGSMLTWRDQADNLIRVKSDLDDQYDPRSRPWYRRAEEAGETVWTDPYIFFTSQHPGITISAPVHRIDGTISGVVGVDIEISSVSEFLANLSIGNSGKALIINRNGDVIAHPDSDLLKVRAPDGSLEFVNIRNFDDPIAREAFSSLGSGFDTDTLQGATSKVRYDGKVYISTLMPAISDDLPWAIGVYAPESDFIGELQKSRRIGIWIAVMVATITAIAGLALANLIHRPVRAFAVRSALIAQGEVDPSQPIPGTYKELAHANETLVREIVARKKTEREYGQTFDLSSRGMAQIAPETGNILKANAEFCAITGYDRNELEQMRYGDLVHEDDPTRLHSDLLTTKNGYADRQEDRFVRKDGKIIDVAVNAILIRDYNGKPLHAVITLDDITETKEKENQIARLNRDLFMMARGHTMGQMAAGLAHELNQPLSAIAQNADTALLLISDVPNLPSDLQEILTEIEQQSLRAGDIIRALRGFIMKDASNTASFDITKLIEQAVKLVQPEAREAGVTIIQRAGILPKVKGNRIQIAQVIVNLLRNAVEAMTDRDLTQRHITIDARKDDSWLRVSVEDTGPGIDPTLKLFTQFETSKPQGMGLGLTICRSMIEANGGELWLDATYFDGARFCFTLPVPPLSEDGRSGT